MLCYALTSCQISEKSYVAFPQDVSILIYSLIQCPQKVYNFYINRFVAFYRLSADLKIESGGTLESVKQGFI